MDKTTFDFESFKKQAAERLKAGESFFGRDGVLTPLLKEFVEEALDGELDAHLESDGEQSSRPNRRNGRKTKSVNTGLGKVPIEAPRDRAGTFQPQILPKRERTLGVDLDKQIIALYARGASYGDIRDHFNGHLWLGGLCSHHIACHGQDPASDRRLACTATGGSVSVCLARCHSLQSAS